jgi:hypothetical protein
MDAAYLLIYRRALGVEKEAVVRVANFVPADNFKCKIDCVGQVGLRHGTFGLSQLDLLSRSAPILVAGPLQKPKSPTTSSA